MPWSPRAPARALVPHKAYYTKVEARDYGRGPDFWTHYKRSKNMSRPYTKALRDVERLDTKVKTLRQDRTANPDHVRGVAAQRDRARRHLAALRRLACQIFERQLGEV